MWKVLTNDGPFLLENRHKRTYVKQIAILLTDGKSNLNNEFTIPNADAAQDDDIEIFAIGTWNSSYITPAETYVI